MRRIPIPLSGTDDEFVGPPDPAAQAEYSAWLAAGYSPAEAAANIAANAYKPNYAAIIAAEKDKAQAKQKTIYILAGVSVLAVVLILVSKGR